MKVVATAKTNVTVPLLLFNDTVLFVCWLQANIRAIRAKFFAEGLRAHTGILTGSNPLSGHQVPVPDPAEVSSCYCCIPGISAMPPANWTGTP